MRERIELMKQRGEKKLAALLALADSKGWVHALRNGEALFRAVAQAHVGAVALSTYDAHGLEAVKALAWECGVVATTRLDRTAAMDLALMATWSRLSMDLDKR